jgi:hypothetical protein
MADRPPDIPVGLGAYRCWECWPYQRLGVRAYLRSTYDRTGHNRTADASHYLYQLAEDFNVTLDVEGSGVLYFTRANRWHGSPWHYEIDGRDQVVEETTTRDPSTPLTGSVFVPEQAFPEPLAYTYATTKGSDVSWVPMPFGERLRIAHSRTYYGTGNYLYHLFTDPTGLQPWDLRSVPDSDVLELLAGAGSDIVRTADLRSWEGGANVSQGERVKVADIDDAPAMLRKLNLSAPADRAARFGACRLVITWDDRAVPSIDAPLALFFGAGTLHNPDGREWLVKAFPVSIRFADGRVHLRCYFPMPFFRRATIELVDGSGSGPIEDVRWAVSWAPYNGPSNHVGYFHATYRDHHDPQMGHDLEFLDTAGVEGAGEWSGSLVGTSFIFTRRNVMTTLEGDPRFYFDDSLTPQVQGTGTEEWGGGGDYWGGRTMTLPLAGHPTGAVDGAQAKHPDELIHSAYRFLLADLMPFGRRARICFEHGGENESREHYESVTYWYGLPAVSLVPTDVLDVGDDASERAHDYRSPDATPPYTVRSRYEWGPDHLPAALAGPLASPRDYVEYEFYAAAGSYHLWIEVRIGEELFEAALWPQLNDHIGTTAFEPRYMGSMGFLNLGRSPGAYTFTTGLPPVSAVALAEGRQRLRLQPRHGKIRFGRVLLSPSRSQRPTPAFRPSAGEVVLTSEQISVRRGHFEVTEDAEAPGGFAVALTRAPDQVQIYPAREMTGRRTESASEFTLATIPDNHGVLLRRTLDYAYANQRAVVYVEHEGRWCAAGTWYLAGSSTVYHSFPWQEGELAPVRPVIITSNRRFRDDEFLLPARLTRGKERLRLRVEFAPRNPPLLPHLEPAPSAWTEFAYRVYAWVMPAIDF